MQQGNNHLTKNDKKILNLVLILLQICLMHNLPNSFIRVCSIADPTIYRKESDDDKDDI